MLTSQVVIETAARLGITPAQAALQWLLQLAPNVLLIPGTGSVAHLRGNLAAEGIALDDEALRQLDAVAPWPDDPSRALSGHDHRTGFRACTDRGRHRRRGRKRQDSVPSSSTATGTSSTICRPRRQPGLRGRGAGALRALRRVCPLRRGIRPGDQHRRRRCDVAPCAGRQYRIGRARPGVRCWHGGTKLRAPQRPRAARREPSHAAAAPPAARVSP